MLVKTRLQEQLEQEYGAPLPDILREALHTELSITGAAKRIRVSRPTFTIWCLANGVDAEREIALGTLKRSA